jgi:hypothetical protein
MLIAVGAVAFFLGALALTYYWVAGLMPWGVAYEPGKDGSR